MNQKLEHDYERKFHNEKVDKKYKLMREGGHTRLYDEHFAKHLKKTQKLQEAVRLLKGEIKKVNTPESDLDGVFGN